MKRDLVDGVPESVVNAWREDLASSAELRRAYTKFIWRRRERARPWRFGRWALAALVFSGGLAFAAVGVRYVRSARVASDSLTSALTTDRSAVAEHSSQRVRRRVAAPEASTSAAAEASQPPAQSPTMEAAVPRASTAPVRAAPSASAGSGSSAWQRAAKGLRERDVAATEAALHELETSGSAADGEAARLIRSQLLLAVGRVTEAEQQLEKLAAEARSPAVKRKAALLLVERRRIHHEF
jgi:hypothetical protein